MSTANDRPGTPRDIAIVGMACVMPGAPDLETFWANIVDGVDSVTEVPTSRWVPDLYFDQDYDGSKRKPGEPPMSVSKWGGFVPDVGFDALAWGIPPTSLGSIDPAQLLALKAAAGAVADAGYGLDSGAGAGRRPFDGSRTSLIYGTGSGGVVDTQAGVTLRLLLRAHGVRRLPPELDAFLTELTEDGLPGALTSLISGRVANRLDLGGKNLTVDSACASVLAALEIACDDLAAGSSDMVLVGGVDLHNGAGDYVSFTAAHALSRRGRCFAFDADADGMTLAEGAGCIALKRLDDALADGDRIYAVIKGIAGSSDGRHLGLTAPRQEGQEKAVRRAYARSGMSPRDIGLVEAHGTGTPVGDRIELQTTTAVFSEAGVPPGSVVIGSVKSNIGHIKCASGVAALIKAAKSAYHGVLPPTLHVREPTDAWDPETSPFVFLDQARPWLADRRLVAVSSFGFGGTNFHAILENHGGPGSSGGRPAGSPIRVTSGRPHWPSELFAFRGHDDAAVDAQVAELADRLAEELTEPRQADRVRLRDIAASISGVSPTPPPVPAGASAGTGAPDARGAGVGPVRLAIVADDLDDLAAKVADARAGRTPAGAYRADPEWTASGVAFLVPGVPGPAQHAVRPGLAADVLVAFPAQRGGVAAAAPEWAAAMLPPQAFGADLDRQAAALDRVAGPVAAVAGLTHARLLADLGVVPARIAGWGTPLLAARGAADALQEALVATSLGEAAPPWPPAELACALGATGDDDTGIADTDLIRDELRELHAEGIDVFVDLGPGDALTGLVADALADSPHVAVAVDRPGQHGVTALLHALAQLAVAGVPVDLDALHAGRGSDPARWEDPGRRPAWIVNGHCARSATGDPLPTGVKPADQAPTVRLGDGAGDGAGDLPAATGNGTGNGTGADGAAVPAGAGGAAGLAGSLSPGDLAVVTEYLRIVQQMIATGSEIVRGHVTATDSPAPGTNGHGAP